MKTPRANFDAILAAMSVPELERLDRALSGAREAGTTIDLNDVLAALRLAPEPKLPGDQQWRDATDGGRGYELLLDGGDPAAATAQHEQEWVRARELVAAGLSLERAWEKIRDQATVAVLKADPVPEPLPPKEDHRRRGYLFSPVSWPAPPAKHAPACLKGEGDGDDDNR